MKLLLLCLLTLLGHALGSLQVVPAATWTTTDGRPVDAHGAGIVVSGGIYYLIGESRAHGFNFSAVTCYSSRDLVRWDYVGALLTRTEGGDLGPDGVVERPKVIYNDKTRKFVLWMHVDSKPHYKTARVGVATGDSVCGKYAYRGSFQPLGFQSRDMGLFKDDDGSAYLLTEDRVHGLRVNALSDDYLHVAKTTRLFPEHIEAPAMVKVNKRYYLFGSRLSGWNPNDNIYTSSASLTSGWTEWQTFADVNSKTYQSQTTFIVDAGNGTIIYMGDRWASKNLQSSLYVWLPLQFKENSVVMKNMPAWIPNVGHGPWLPPPPRIKHEAEVGVLRGSAKKMKCDQCSSGLAVGFLGGPGAGTLTLSGIESKKDGLTTVRIKFVNADHDPRYAAVSVNGEPPITVVFQSTAGALGVTSIHVKLRAGKENTLMIAGKDGGNAPNVDRVIVPVE